MNSELKIKDKTSPISNIKIDPFRKNIRKTLPHKHNNYFEIIYLSKGSGFHTIDTKQFSITPPIVFLVRREQVHFWKIDKEPTGFVLIIKKSFIEKSLDKEMKQMLSILSEFSCLFPKESNTIDQLFHLLSQEYKYTSNSSTVVEGLLKALLGKLLQTAEPVKDNSIKKENLFYEFQELLVQEKKLINNVAHYAKILHTTPQNLNAVCRKENKLSASETLSEYIINEAKRLLLYTDLNVSEISYSLDFKDNSHFSKYFKRFTGETPNTFRNSDK
jgi:AraC-like DNA-binding protein